MADLATPFAVRTVATLRVADAVRDGPVAIEELAKHCDAEPDSLGRVLRFLVERGVFTEPELNVFGPNAASRVLESDAPRESRGWLDLDGAVGRADLAFVELLQQVRGERSAYPAAFGRSFWEDLAHSPQLSDSFDALMESKSHGLAPLIAAGYDWDRFERLADVGGGKGVLLAAILREYPSVRGVLIDLPGPTRNAVPYLRGREVDERTDIIAVDFFDRLPTSADAFVLCDVLGDWDDEDAVRILRRCAEAAGTDGSVIIVELMPDDEQSREVFTEMDLRMMVYVGGRMRNLDQTRALATSAGLFVATVTQLDNGYSIAECLPDR